MTELLLPDAGGIARAVALLRAGRLVAFATETVYGLGANATNAASVDAVFAAKGRPAHNPLISHYPSAEAAFVDVVPTQLARDLAENFWPGPLTLVLPRRPHSRVCANAAAGLATLAVRIPGHPDALNLLRAVGCPLAAPSANPSGQISPTRVEHVLTGLAGRIDAVIDSGPCRVGVESTVIDLSGAAPALLRPGGVPREAIEALIGPLAGDHGGDGAVLRSPGLLASHYAPRLPVRLNAMSVAHDEALLAFGPPLTGAASMYNLSESADLVQAAANLFDGLHQLDREGARFGLVGIAVMPIPSFGLGLAITDRLSRAAADR